MKSAWYTQIGVAMHRYVFQSVSKRLRAETTSLDKWQLNARLDTKELLVGDINLSGQFGASVGKVKRAGMNDWELTLGGDEHEKRKRGAK